MRRAGLLCCDDCTSTTSPRDCNACISNHFTVVEKHFAERLWWHWITYEMRNCFASAAYVPANFSAHDCIARTWHGIRARSATDGASGVDVEDEDLSTLNLCMLTTYWNAPVDATVSERLGFSHHSNTWTMPTIRTADFKSKIWWAVRLELHP